MTTWQYSMGLSRSAPDTGTDTPSWSERWDGALCTQSDAELWFTDTDRARAEAKRICRSCPLIDECRDISAEERHGVWAAIDRGEPDRLRNQELSRLSKQRHADRLAQIAAVAS